MDQGQDVIAKRRPTPLEFRHGYCKQVGDGSEVEHVEYPHRGAAVRGRRERGWYRGGGGPSTRRRDEAIRWESSRFSILYVTKTQGAGSQAG